MTASVITPVIPLRPRPGLVTTGRPGERRLPLALPSPAVPRAPGAVYGTGRDASGGVTCPRDWRAAAGWETATGPAPGHAQPGRSDRRLTPASRKGPESA